MQVYKSILFLIICALFFTACNPDEETFVPNINVEGNIDVFYSSLDPSYDAVMMSPDEEQNLVVSELEIHVPAHVLLDAAGNPVDGFVELRVIHSQDKEDLVRNNWTSQTRDGILLNFIDLIYIDFYQDGEKLFLKTGAEISVNYSADFLNEQMLLFQQDSIKELHSRFVGLTNGANYIFEPTTPSVEIKINRLGWYMFVTPLDISAKFMELCVALGENYDPTNAAVYLVYKDLPIVQQVNFSGAQDCNKEFVLIEDQLAQVVAIANKSGVVNELSSYEILTTQGMSMTMTPIARSMDYIEQVLEGL